MKTPLLERDNSKYSIEGKLGELLQDGVVLKAVNNAIKKLDFSVTELELKGAQKCR